MRITWGLILAIFLFICGSANSHSTSLVQIQLKDIKQVGVSFHLDSELGIDENILRQKVVNSLMKAGIDVADYSKQSLEIVAKGDRSSTNPNEVALYVAIRFHDDVELKRDPALNLKNFPTITWMSETVRSVPLSELQEKIERWVTYEVELFSDNVQYASKVAKEN